MAGFLQGLFVYLCGVIFLTGITIAEKDMARRRWAVVLVIYVVSPWAAMYANGVHESAATKHADIVRAAGETINNAAMDQYCQHRNRIIHRKAGGEPVASLLVSDGEFSVSAFFDQMKSDPALCSRTGVRFLEDKSSNGKIHLYSICSRANFTVIPAAQARYELVFTPQMPATLAPWQGPNRPYDNTISASRVQIIDRFTSAVLAEDTSYQLRANSFTGNACPSQQALVNQLVLDVFAP